MPEGEYPGGICSLFGPMVVENHVTIVSDRKSTTCAENESI